MNRLVSRFSNVSGGSSTDAPCPVGSDPQFFRALERIERYARFDSALVVLEGESGTGKNYLAKHIHRVSPRATSPFREVSLAALDDGVAGSELFGHVAGAYTDARHQRAGHFTSANRGTLFLDEIGKASFAVQKKLLRIVETGECWPIGSDRPVPVDVRLVAATNVPLRELVSRGEFLPDLYARLGSFQVRIPPLRERPADIKTLALHFVEKHAGRCGYEAPPRVHPELMAALERWTWPFNVREIEGTILRLMVDATGATELGLGLCEGDLEYLLTSPRPPKPTLSLELVQRAFAETGSISGAAKTLGVHRATLYRQFPDVTAKALQPAVDRDALPS